MMNERFDVNLPVRQQEEREDNSNVNVPIESQASYEETIQRLQETISKQVCCSIGMHYVFISQCLRY